MWVTFAVRLNLNRALRLRILFFKLAVAVSLVFIGWPFQPREVDMCCGAFTSVALALSSRPGRQDWAALERLSPKASLADVLRVLGWTSVTAPVVLIPRL